MSKQLIPKCLNPAGPIEYVGMPKEEFDWMVYMFENDPNNPQYKLFLQYAKNKYGRLGDTKLPEVVVKAKRPEKSVKENAKETILEIKETVKNLPTETKVDLALTGAGFIPGLDIIADVADIGREVWKGNWGNVALGVGMAAIPGLSLAGYKTYLAVKNANKARKFAKEFEHAINERIWRDGRNIEKYGYNPRRIIMGTPAGKPEPDADTFFHSGNFVSTLQPGTPVPQRRGYVRVKDGQIHPIDGGSGEPRVWWNKGDNYGNGEVILTTKSSKVDDQVISSPEKYKDSDIVHYSPNYYTSGAIPLDEVDIYYRNPLTGDYDHPIQHTPTTPKVEGNVHTNFYDIYKLVREEQALAEKIAENNRLLDMLDEFSEKHAIKDLIAGTDGWEDVVLTYPKADRTTVTSNRRTNKQIRDVIARHNTFARGVLMPSNPEDIEHIRSVFGDDWMDKQDEVLKYIATHQRPGTGGFFIAPTGNASMYGNERNGLGRVNLIRRKYKLGKDRSKWFDEGDFVFQQHPIYSGITFDETSDIIAPWLNPNTWTRPGSNVIPYRETELISPKDMHWVKFVKADTDFGASTSFNTQFNWNKYKAGGRLIPKHAKGSPVNNNPLPKMPINTNPIPEAKPKKIKRLIRPTPDFITWPKGNTKGYFKTNPYENK